MNDVKLKLNDRGRGGFTIDEDGTQTGEMEIAVSSVDLVVYHTEVKPEHEGKGFAKQLFDAMLVYARDRKLNVVPLCRYVHAQFERAPEKYKDVWQATKRNRGEEDIT